MGWTGYRVITQLFSDDVFSVESLPDMSVLHGQDFSLSLKGAGFSFDTKVTLSSKLHNDEAVVTSLPFDGVMTHSQVVGNRIYLGGYGTDLKVFDIDNPEFPRLMKSYLPGRTMTDIYHAAGRLYVSCGRMGISILKIKEDGLLVHEAEIRTTSTISSTVYSEGFLYAAAGKTGIEVYDVASSDQVHKQRTLEDSAFVSELSLYEQTLFALSPRTNEINVYSVKNPSAPQHYSVIKVQERIYDIACMEKHLFIATATGLIVYLMDDNNNLHYLRKVASVGPAHKLYVGHDSLYVVDSFSGVAIADPLTGEIKATPQFSEVRSIAEAGNYLFLTGSPRGLSVVSLEKIHTKRKLRSISTRGKIMALAEHDGHLFAAGGKDGVLVATLGSAENAQRVTRISTKASSSMAIKGNYLFVAQLNEGIQVFDISHVDNPVLVSQWKNFTARKIVLYGSYLVVDQGLVAGLNLVDISDLNQPRIVDCRTDNQLLDIAVSGEYLFAVDREKGLIAFRQVHQKLVRVGRLYTPFPMNQFDLSLAVTVYDNVAYVASGRSGFLVVDISDPVQMRTLTAVPLPGFCKGLYVHESRLYAISHRAGISVFDLADSAHPRTLSHLNISSLSAPVLVVDDEIYLAQSTGSLLVLPKVILPQKTRIISSKRLDVQFSSPPLPGVYGLQLSNRNGLVKLDTVIEIYEKNALEIDL
jgi:hypothetical protein